LTRATAGFARATGDYERFAPDIGRAYRLLGLPDHVDAGVVARHELRWWVVRREIGLAAGAAAGESITDLYAALYDLPRELMRAAEGRLPYAPVTTWLRSEALHADVLTLDPLFLTEVARLLRASYSSLKTGLAADQPVPASASSPPARPSA
jgi:hypothetical protein